MTLRGQDSLKWVHNAFSLEPQWTTDIDPESIEQAIRSNYSTQRVQVSFLTQGALSKLYNVQTDSDTLVMRVSLPVDPYWKTISEVATMQWIRLNTALPVPKILAYQDSRENAIGFEWILMTKIPGKTLADAWISIPWKAKEQLVHQLATYSSNLFKKKLRKIGNIYPSSNPFGNDTLPQVERIVSMQFFWGDHVRQNVPRGPFRSSKGWIAARLLFNEHDCKSTLANSQDEDDREDAERTLKIIKRLRTHLRAIFPDTGKNSELSILHHDDLSKHNIMVDDNGKLTGVVDWECVSAVPLWKACDYPSFLEGPSREEKPDKTTYRCDEPGSLYRERLMEYELTVLRRCFIDEMQRLEPGWIKIFESSKTQRDFDMAVRNCDNEFLARFINEWLDDFAPRKEVVSLRDRINAP
jgi:aminoglycoside phosphotransferase